MPSRRFLCTLLLLCGMYVLGFAITTQPYNSVNLTAPAGLSDLFLVNTGVPNRTGLLSITSNGPQGTISFYPVSPNGTFGTPLTTLANDATTFLYDAQGDLNNDGIADVITSGAVNGVRVYLGNANGGFGPGVKLNIPVATAVSIGDVNSDSKPDLLWGGSNAGVNSLALLLGNGDGTFQPPVYSPNGSNDVPTAMWNGDLIGDGKPLLLAISFNSNSLRVYNILTNGTMSFGAAYGTSTQPFRIMAGRDFVGKRGVTIASYSQPKLDRFFVPSQSFNDWVKEVVDMQSPASGLSLQCRPGRPADEGCPLIALEDNGAFANCPVFGQPCSEQPNPGISFPTGGVFEDLNHDGYFDSCVAQLAGKITCNFSTAAAAPDTLTVPAAGSLVTPGQDVNFCWTNKGNFPHLFVFNGVVYPKIAGDNCQSVRIPDGTRVMQANVISNLKGFGQWGAYQSYNNSFLINDPYTQAFPANGSGSTQNYQDRFYKVLGTVHSAPRDLIGHANLPSLSVLNILFNNFLDGRRACYLAYVVATSTLVLVNDGGDAGGPYAGSVALGNPSAVIQNSQCAVSLISAVDDGTAVTLTLTVTFKPAFGGNKIHYMAARDTVGNNTGWTAAGVWQVPPGPSGQIVVTSTTPGRSELPAGTAQPLVATLTDSKGAADFGVVNVLVNNFIDGRQACYLAYVAASRTLLLVNDGGDAGGPFAGSMVVNGNAATIQNSQCSISGVGSSAVTSGNTLTLTLNITFKPGFNGNRVIWVAGRDGAGANNTDWQSVATALVRPVS